MSGVLGTWLWHERIDCQLSHLRWGQPQVPVLAGSGLESPEVELRGEGCFRQEMRVKEGRVGEETEKLMQRGWNLKEFTLCDSSLPEADEVTG